MVVWLLNFGFWNFLVIHEMEFDRSDCVSKPLLNPFQICEASFSPRVLPLLPSRWISDFIALFIYIHISICLSRCICQWVPVRECVC